MVVLGSGGHSAEMFAILKDLDTSLYTHRSYVVSEGDQFGASKAVDFERSILKKRKYGVTPTSQKGVLDYDIYVVPRARKIHQTLFTTPISAFRCLISCFHILRSPSTTFSSTPTPWYPDLVMTNGPGTAVCVVLACLLLRFFDVRGTRGKMRTIYVESWARVKSLSLSGKILIRCVDRFLVQWESLKGVGGRAEYIGVLV